MTSQGTIMVKKDYEKLKDPSMPDEKKQKFLTDYDKVWICEFCRVHNSIKKNYNPPKPENPCFLLKKALKKKVEIER